VNSRFYVGTSDFFPEIQEKLVPKTFSSRCMVPLDNCHVTIKEYSSEIRKAAFTLEQVIFSVKSKKNLFSQTAWQSIQLHVMRIDGAAADFSKVFSSIFLKDYRRTQLHIHYVIYSSVKVIAIFSKVFRRPFSHFY